MRLENLIDTLTREVKTIRAELVDIRTKLDIIDTKAGNAARFARGVAKRMDRAGVPGAPPTP